MHAAVLVAVVLAVEALLAVALWIDTKERRARMRGVPSVVLPPRSAWVLVLVGIGAIPAAWLIHRADWLSLGFHLFALLAACLMFYTQTKRLRVLSVPYAQVAGWVEEAMSALGKTPQHVRLHDKWQEARSVSVEVASGSRRELIALADALRPRVEAHPSPGPWTEPDLSTRIVAPVLVSMMVLFPVAVVLMRAGY
ncbi:MAG: hypothetical protein ACOC1F_14560 [Myxococcota bacterium]